MEPYNKWNYANTQETSESRSKQFWMVVGSGNNPKVRHPSEAVARSEAERLARSNPGVEFYVMKAVEVFEQPSGMVHRKF